MSRPRSAVPSTVEQVRAVMRHRLIYELGTLIPADPPVGRRPVYPGYLLIAFGVLARMTRSGAKLDAELRTGGLWPLMQAEAAAMRDELPDELWAPPGDRAPTWAAWQYARNTHLTTDVALAEMHRLFIAGSVAQARSLGLLDPKGPGSLNHPARSRTVYGDGTVVRSLYKPPPVVWIEDPETGERVRRYRDKGTGELVDTPTRRYDPDSAEWHGHTGPVHGTNLVVVYARGDAAFQRVVLAVGRAERPGREAEAAVLLIGDVHRVAGAGVQAVVYDGALRGVHLEKLMTRHGLVVVNKVAAAPLSDAEKAERGGLKAVKSYPLGSWEHDTDDGACTHALAAVDGAIVEVTLGDTGDPVVAHRLTRRQVKRPRRGNGNYHFSAAFVVPCARGDFDAWITPHGEPGDPDARRAENVRLIAEGEEDFARLYGIRNDSEAFNSAFKRSLLVNRAMSLGWRRQLLDAVCFALLSNAVVAHRAAQVGVATPASSRGRSLHSA
ncbi:hypothetical protein [Blastococcus sp. CCUG 61487]|uniref:hypothetical protein n=1 Tax=Blastococcus sp. CCUG 61487 TaxID=1840703 RepID=UPI0010C117BF|nr:hypothetical protein [Blastococcus sp. CCUG 61487]TKJ28478.1 hypothetical protein A6V29_00065 [Blastococcus sp. CCUG 61487]